MASLEVDRRLLRAAPLPELARYYKELLNKHENETITECLLAGLATDSLPFRCVAVWIKGFANERSVVRALRYSESVGVRRVAIRRFQRFFRDEKRMSAALDALGGKKGLVKLFAELSVDDVQSFCHALGRTCTWNVAKEARQKELTEFTTRLITTEKNPETRNFIKFYALIVPACSGEFVRAWEANEALPRAGGRWMDHAHYMHTRERCIQHLQTEHSKDCKLKYFLNVLHDLPPTPAGGNMSQSMAYSREILDFLGQHPDIRVSEDTIINVIFVPLMRRMKRRGVRIQVKADVLRSLERALRHRVVGNERGFGMNQWAPLPYALDCWNRGKERHQDLLVGLIRLAPDSSRQTILSRIATAILPRVRPEFRYELFGLLVKHMPSVAKDLENDEDINELGTWPTVVFDALPSDQSYNLLQRLITLRHDERWAAQIFMSLQPEHATLLLQDLCSLRPAGDFIVWDNRSVSTDPVFSLAENRDVTLLQLYVSPASEDRDCHWEAVVEERKKEAAKAREQSDRATWIRSAIFCSAASKSLDIYQATLLWARRFNRDALTVKRIYDRDTIATEPAVSLLSGISANSRDVETISRDIQKSNQILLLLLETAFQCIREPSFQYWHWKGVLCLFTQVVARRLENVDRLQDRLGLSDARMYDSVWHQTILTIISAEEQCLEDKHETLQARESTGILNKHDLPVSQTFRPSTCKFADELARCRDELWTRYRRSQDPNVVSLGAPFPKGLSFQDLLPMDFDDGYPGKLPYLEARAESIVLADAQIALLACPTDLADRRAIGQHVDDYGETLRWYVDAGIEDAERQRRKTLAWEHATGPLSKPRGMSRDQSQLFWQSTFHRVLTMPPQADINQYRPDPVLPSVEDPEEPTEWNPDPDPTQWTEQSQPLEATCLDVMISESKVGHEEGAIVMRVPDVATPVVFRRAFWQNNAVRPIRYIAPAVREALVALALMLINTKCCPSKRLFSNAFPGSEDVRFPAMFLDEEFLDRRGASEELGLVILEKLSRDTPLTLVAELCRAMLANLGSEGDTRAMYEFETLRLLKILVNSDRPDLAVDLVHDVVIDRPDASSWHRHMLTQGLFERLKCEQACRFLQRLQSSVVRNLQEQAKRKRTSEDTTEVSSKPIVKVTTVTAMAQLLSKATFISSGEAVSMLVELFASASHADIRVAIVQSLTSVLRKTPDQDAKAQIVDALEKHAVPVAASINERSPLSEEHWQAAESTLNVPEINEPGSTSVQPVLRAVIDACKSLSGETVNQIYHRILLPILDASTANNARWTRLFLRKHNLHCDARHLPEVPPKPHFLTELLRGNVDERREQILSLIGSAIMVNFDPPLDILRVNQTILERPELRTSNGGKHWLSLWSNSSGVQALSIAGVSLHHYLISPKPGISGNLPISLLQELVYQQLEVMTARYDTRPGDLDYMLTQLARPKHKNFTFEEVWDANVRSLVRRLVDHIESLRTPEWQRQSHRVPATLPDTFDMRLWLLSWPGWQNIFLDRSDHNARVDAFGGEISAMLGELAASGKPYHGYFPRLKDAALAINPQDLLPLALRLACEWQRLRLEDYLRVEIAEAQLLKLDSPIRKDQRDLGMRMGDMVASWKSSADETVRMSGTRVASALVAGQKQERWRWFWEVWGTRNL